MRILIEKTKKTPYVHFDYGIIEIVGRSILEDSTDFFMPLIGWISDYINNPASFTSIKLVIEYSNSNSNKFLFKILALLDNCHKNGTDMKIDWFYEKDDDSIIELGNDFKTLIKIPFNLVEIE